MQTRGGRRLVATASRLPSHARELPWRSLDLAGGVRRYLSCGGVALTFDDGPQPCSTDRVLDVLAELRVPATFFCVGANARAHPALLRRIVEEGHRVGSHSLTHRHPARLPLAAVRREYAEGRQAVEGALSDRCPTFRPPHGHVTYRHGLLLRSLGLRTWLASVDPEDWQPGRRPGDIVDVVSRARDGDVVLLHDWIEQPTDAAALDRSATIAALPDIVRNLRRRGLDFVRLPQ